MKTKVLESNIKANGTEKYLEELVKSKLSEEGKKYDYVNFLSFQDGYAIIETSIDGEYQELQFSLEELGTTVEELSEMGAQPAYANIKADYYTPGNSSNGPSSGFEKIGDGIKEIDKAVEDIRLDVLDLDKDIGKVILTEYTNIKKEIIRLNERKADLKDKVSRMQKNYDLYKKS